MESILTSVSLRYLQVTSGKALESVDFRNET